MAQAASADDHAGGARVQQRDGLTDRVVGRDARVGQGGDVLWPGLRVQFHAGPGRGQQVFGHAAVGGQAGERAVDAVHVVAGPAGVAQPAGRGGVQDDGVADGHVGHRRTDLMHPAGVLVPEDVGQRCAHRRVPLALDDVQVGAADPGPADLHDDVERAADLWLGNLVDHRHLVKFVQADGLHWSSSSSVPGRSRSGAASMPRQMLPLDSILIRVVRALRRCKRHRVVADGRPGLRVDQQRRVVAGGQAQLRPALPQPVQRARARQVTQDHAPQPRRVGPGRDERPAHLIGAGHDRLAQKVGAQPVQLADRLAVERLRETRVRGHAAVDRVRGEMIFQHDLGVPYPRQRGTAS